MTTKLKLVLAVALFAAPASLVAQGLDPASLLKPPINSWPTYSGDYSGQRFSTLTQVNQTTVKDLALQWVGHLTGGAGNAAGGGRGAAAGPPTYIGGEVAEPV